MKKSKIVILWVLVIFVIILELLIINARNSKKNAIDVASMPDENTEDVVEKIEEVGTKIKLSNSSLILMNGETNVINASYENLEELVWSSNNEEIVTVNNSGEVKAISPGTAEIKVESPDGKVGICTIIVKSELTYSKSIVKGNKTTVAMKPGTSTNNEPTRNQSNNNNEEISNKTPDAYECVVEFKVDGTIVETKMVKKGETIETLPANPRKSGYIFKGWVYDGKDFDEKITIEDNISVVAEWNKYTFEIQLINGDENSPNRIVKAYENDSPVVINEIYGDYNGDAEYTLGTRNSGLGDVRIVSYRQFESAKNYKVKLSTGEVVFAEEK